jgi:hypothetical protein
MLVILPFMFNLAVGMFWACALVQLLHDWPTRFLIVIAVFVLYNSAAVNVILMNATRVNICKFSGTTCEL